jgi:hypothetical protein
MTFVLSLPWLQIVWYRIGDYESEMIALGEMKVIPDKNMQVQITRDTAANTATSSIKISGLRFSDFAVYQCAIQGSGVAEQKISGTILMAETEGWWIIYMRACLPLFFW